MWDSWYRGIEVVVLVVWGGSWNEEEYEVFEVGCWIGWGINSRGVWGRKGGG